MQHEGLPPSSVLLSCQSLLEYILAVVIKGKMKSWSTLEASPNFMCIWSPRHLIKMQILIYYICDGAWDSAFLTSSPLIPICWVFLLYFHIVRCLLSASQTLMCIQFTWCYLRNALGAISMRITWRITKNTDSQASPLTYQIRICILVRSQGDSYAWQGLRSIQNVFIHTGPCTQKDLALG